MVSHCSHVLRLSSCTILCIVLYLVVHWIAISLSEPIIPTLRSSSKPIVRPNPNITKDHLYHEVAFDTRSLDRSPGSILEPSDFMNLIKARYVSTSSLSTSNRICTRAGTVLPQYESPSITKAYEYESPSLTKAYEHESPSAIEGI